MKKVEQSTYSMKDGKPTGTKGDCWSACVASVLELRIEDVPRFIDEPTIEESMKKYHEFMGDHGFEVLNFNTSDHTDEEVVEILSRFGESPVFVVGDSFKGDWQHQVIYKNGKLYHDPNDLKKGVKKINEIEALIMINPRSQKQ